MAPRKASIGSIIPRPARTFNQELAFGVHRGPSRLPRLLGNLCHACGRYSFPRQFSCPRCGCNDLAEVGLSKRGRLETFAILRYALPGYAGPLPYVVGTIQLPEGVTLRAFVSGCHPEELRTGMEVELDPARGWEGRAGSEVLTQTFRPM